MSRRDPTNTLSIGSATLTLTRLNVPGTDFQASTVVGQMVLPSEGTGGPIKRLVAIGTALEPDGSEVESSAGVRYLLVDAVSSATPRHGRRHRNRSTRRRHR